MKDARVINIANFKGGVGKTTTTTVTAYCLSKLGYKCLVIDFDPQGNATEILLPEFNYDLPTIHEALLEKNLKRALHPVKDNLDIITADLDLVGFSLMLDKERRSVDEKAMVLRDLIQPLRSEYDYIFIDVPPTISDFTNNALTASDYVIIVLQTQGHSFSAAEKFLPYITQIADNYNENLNLLGIVPVLHTKNASVDQFVIKQAKEYFAQALFNSVIHIRERVKYYAFGGISDSENDRWDKEALGQFEALGKEVIQRIEEIEG